jgi:hypothetical protein
VMMMMMMMIIKRELTIKDVINYYD